MFNLISCVKSNEYVIYGRVVNVATGKGLANASVKLFSEEDSRLFFNRKPAKLSTLTDNDGYYRFSLTAKNNESKFGELYYFVEFEQEFNQQITDKIKIGSKEIYLPNFFQKDLSAVKRISLGSSDSVNFYFATKARLNIQGKRTQSVLSDGYINLQLTNIFDTIYNFSSLINASNYGNLDIMKEVITGKQKISYQILNNGNYIAKDTLIFIESDYWFEFTF